MLTDRNTVTKNNLSCVKKRRMVPSAVSVHGVVAANIYIYIFIYLFIYLFILSPLLSFSLEYSREEGLS